MQIKSCQRHTFIFRLKMKRTLPLLENCNVDSGCAINVCFGSNSTSILYFLTCYFQSLFPRSAHLRAFVLFQQTFQLDLKLVAACLCTKQEISSSFHCRCQAVRKLCLLRQNKPKVQNQQIGDEAKTI